GDWNRSDGYKARSQSSVKRPCTDRGQSDFCARRHGKFLEALSENSSRRSETGRIVPHLGHSA
ncbi:unnamed protein product, partial [Discosporangium mesarthrocarpum]